MLPASAFATAHLCTPMDRALILSYHALEVQGVTSGEAHHGATSLTE